MRLAELEIDSAHLETFKSLLTAEIEASIAAEAGVRALYAVSLADDLSRIRIFEIYDDLEAYEAHLRAPHFLAYKERTQAMVRSLTLLEADPIVLGHRKGRRLGRAGIATPRS